MLAAALALRFLLELILLAALAFWGFHAGEGLALRLLAGLAAPAAAALLWGLFVSPNRRFELGRIKRLLLELALLALAAAALWQLGRPIAGLLLAVASADRFGLIWLRRREIARHNSRYRTYS